MKDNTIIFKLSSIDSENLYLYLYERCKLKRLITIPKDNYKKFENLVVYFNKFKYIMNSDLINITYLDDNRGVIFNCNNGRIIYENTYFNLNDELYLYLYNSLSEKNLHLLKKRHNN